jgi:hypothetical protein
MTAEEREAERRGIGVGMVIAAAIIADHDPIYAEEILNAAGLTSTAAMRAAGCDGYDILKLRALLLNIARRNAQRDLRRARGLGRVERLAA